MLSVFSLSIYAHPVSQNGVVYGDEYIGWVNKESHSEISHLFYKFNDNDPYIYYSLSPYRTIFKAGAVHWNMKYPYAVVNAAEVNIPANSIIGNVQTHESNGDEIAYAHSIYYISTGHLVEWTISMNRNKYSSLNDLVCAHEIGHIFGLNDLYQSRNIDKLMYYSNASTATGITSIDLKGADFMSGVHTSHNFAYKYYVYSPSSHNHHVKYCTSCLGWNSYALCTYTGIGSNRPCTVCGIGENYRPY